MTLSVHRVRIDQAGRSSLLGEGIRASHSITGGIAAVVGRELDDGADPFSGSQLELHTRSGRVALRDDDR